MRNASFGSRAAGDVSDFTAIFRFNSFCFKMLGAVRSIET